MEISNCTSEESNINEVSLMRFPKIYSYGDSNNYYGIFIIIVVSAVTSVFFYMKKDNNYVFISLIFALFAALFLAFICVIILYRGNVIISESKISISSLGFEWKNVSWNNISEIDVSKVKERGHDLPIYRYIFKTKSPAGGMLFLRLVSDIDNFEELREILGHFILKNSIIIREKSASGIRQISCLP